MTQSYLNISFSEHLHKRLIQVFNEAELDGELDWMRCRIRDFVVYVPRGVRGAAAMFAPYGLFEERHSLIELADLIAEESSSQ